MNHRALQFRRHQTRKYLVSFKQVREELEVSQREDVTSFTKKVTHCSNKTFQ